MVLIDFMTGDVVRRTKSGGSYALDYLFTIQETTNLDGERAQYAKCKNNSWHCFDCLTMVKPIPRPWKPVNDEIIRVSNAENPTHWSERKFLCMNHGRFVCQTHLDDDDGHQYFGYLYAKAMPIDTSITLANGTKVKLSEESYNDMIQGIQEDTNIKRK